MASRAGGETCAVSSRTTAPLNPDLSSFPPQGRGFRFGRFGPKFFFSPPSRRPQAVLPRSVLLPWAGVRSRAGSSCLTHRELNRKLGAGLRCRPPPLGHRRDESRAEESTVRAFPEVWREISAAARHAFGLRYAQSDAFLNCVHVTFVVNSVWLRLRIFSQNDPAVWRQISAKKKTQTIYSQKKKN